MEIDVRWDGQVRDDEKRWKSVAAAWYAAKHHGMHVYTWHTCMYTPAWCWNNHHICVHTCMMLKQSLYLHAVELDVWATRWFFAVKLWIKYCFRHLESCFPMIWTVFLSLQPTAIGPMEYSKWLGMYFQARNLQLLGKYLADKRRADGSKQLPLEWLSHLWYNRRWWSNHMVLCTYDDTFVCLQI